MTKTDFESCKRQSFLLESLNKPEEIIDFIDKRMNEGFLIKDFKQIGNNGIGILFEKIGRDKS